ncbi:hypothetical protein PCYB_006070, partial [Plasmodium cynomolgi strain B]
EILLIKIILYILLYVNSFLNIKYSFYEQIDKYLKYEKDCCHDQNCKINNEKCESIDLKDYDNEEELHNICSRFYCLIEKIIKPTSTSNNTTEYVEFEYLNYWLNHELRNINANIDNPKHLLNLMRSQNSQNESLRKLKEKWDKIHKDKMEYMYELFDLYRNCIFFINTTTTHAVNDYPFKHGTNQCVDKYKKLENKCFNEKRTYHCKSFCSFKKKYEGIILKIPNEKVSSLENIEQIQKKVVNFDIPTNIIIGISIAKLGFTSLGSRFPSQNKIKKNIRNNYNRHSNNFLDASEYELMPEETIAYNISYNSA